MSAPFAMRQRLRFAHCDPAGIAYYPRYFELCDHVIEEWTEAVIGVSRRVMHFEQGYGLPTVDLAAQFTAISRLGDELDFALAVNAVGRSSVSFAIGVTCGEERRFVVRYKQVLIDMQTMKSVAWPDGWRARLAEAAR